jgi:NhaA family Na+:H+ antiporter
MKKTMSRRKRLMQPILRFIEAETSGGFALIFITILALVWANSAAAASYFNLWQTKFGIPGMIQMPLSLWINDGLMAIFFFVVGLEIKREILIGELTGFKKASLPVAAALGGMVVPALFYVVFNQGTPTASGWGNPMATDIAFALGILSLAGSRVPLSLKIFLTALAIVDDLGAVMVIAIFYSGHLRLDLLLYAGLILAALGLYGRQIRANLQSSWWLRAVPFIVLSIPVWLLFLNSGVHATIAGVLLALMVPVRPGESEPDPPSLLESMENFLHPWNTFFIVPVFALANAGVALSGGLGQVLQEPAAKGIAFGLLIGKPVGIVLFSWIAMKLVKCELPNNVNWRHMVGAGFLGGIGSTMSLFVTELAFTGNAEAIRTAKASILVTSAIAAVLGLLVVRLRLKRRRPAAA